MVSYATIKKTIYNHRWSVDDNDSLDCVDVAKEAARLYFPGLSLTELGIHGNGNQIYANANPKYWQKIPNDEKNASQVPKPGDIMCFDATPWPGYTNQFKNPYGHVGICDHTVRGGYWLLMQESDTGKAAFLQYKPWKYRHCQGWLRPKNVPTTPPKSNNSQGDVMANLTTKDDLDFLYLACLGRARRVSEGEDVYLNKDPMFVAEDLYRSDEAKARRQNEAANLTDLQDKIDKQADELKTSVDQLNKKQAEVDQADDANAKLLSEVNSLQGDKTRLGKVVENLQGKLKACGETTDPITFKQLVRLIINWVTGWLSKE